MSTTTNIDYDRIIDGMSEAGFSRKLIMMPVDCMAAKTTDYYARKGWDAVRHNGDSLSFARWDDQDGARLILTTLSGVIESEATFDLTRHGARMFTTAAALMP